MRCVVDCRDDRNLSNNYLELNLWGKPCFTYAIESAMSAECFTKVEIITNSSRIKDYCKKRKISVFNNSDEILKDDGEPVFLLSGRAPCISSTTIRDVIGCFNEKNLFSSTEEPVFIRNLNNSSFLSNFRQCEINAFCVIRGNSIDERGYAFYPVKNSEGVVINTDNDFELALILKKKQINRPLVIQTIDKIIAEKQKLLSHPMEGKSICLIGHSQLDQWDIEEIAGYRVRNCAVSGISSFEYNKKIIKRDLLNCDANCFIVMHGTNDIVWDYTIEEIIASIGNTIKYIKKNNKEAPIIFISCIHVNGRLDRSNSRIDELNKRLYDYLGKKVVWVDTSFMDDTYGALNEKYTIDGLHISEIGYDVLRERIEKTMKELEL